MKLESSLFLVEVEKVDRYQKGVPQNVTIFSLMREMVTDKLVAAVFGMTKTLKIE